MASKIIKFCFAARQIGLNKISPCQSVIQCTKCINTRLLIYPVNSSSRNFSSTINRYTEQSLAKNENKDLQKPEEMDVLYNSILLEYKSHDTGVIRSYQKFTEMAAKELDIEISKIYTPKRDITRFAVLKSVHVYKKHKVQYETRTHYKVIELKHLTGSTADTFLEYLQRNLPEGVAMKITKTRLERMPDHILQEQKQRLTELREDHMVLEDVSGTLQDDNENLTQSSLNEAELESENHSINDKTIKATTESAPVDDKKDSMASESVKDSSDSDSDSSSSSSDSDSDSDSESIDKKGETKDSPTDTNS